MYSDYFRTVALLAHHGAGAHSKLASQIGFYFTPASGTALVVVLLVIAVCAVVGALLRAMFGWGR